jgi:flagellin-like hook-associated protein FlgL
MADIVLSKGIRNNLLQLQNTAANAALTQGRLATGKKVNSALDNPSNFFTSSSLNSRANDLSNLLDSLSNGIKVLEAADNGLTAITKTVESLQSTVRQARQDKSNKTASYDLSSGISTSVAANVTFSNGAVASSTTVALQSKTVAGAGTFDTSSAAGSFTIQAANLNGNSAVTINFAQNDTIQTVVNTINSTLSAQSGGNGGVTATVSSGQIALTTASGDSVTLAGTNLAAVGLDSTATATYAAKSVDQLAADINANTTLQGAVRASNDNGKLRVENISTADLTVAGFDSAGKIDGSSGTKTIGANDVRKNLVTQFNDLRNQLDKLSDDASFNGINLLRGDKLKLNFNETSTSTLTIQAKDAKGNASEVSNAKLGITAATNKEFESDTSLDARLDSLKTALDTIRSQASSFGSNLSIVQNRQDFTKSTINTLKTGADNLVLADQNEEAANLLALQTRQQLSQTALSLANQADQGVLRLF